MRAIVFVIFFSLITSLNTSLQAQNDFAKLEKNVNLRAKGLVHYLNTTKDTLILKSETLINKLYSVSKTYEREVDMVINEKFVKVPLAQLSQGKHVFVAVQSPVRIVFVVKILKDTKLILAMDEEKLAAQNEKK